MVCDAGPIPSTMGRLSTVVELNLSGNELTGGMRNVELKSDLDEVITSPYLHRIIVF